MSLSDRDLTEDISISNQSYVQGSHELATGSGVGITGTPGSILQQFNSDNVSSPSSIDQHETIDMTKHRTASLNNNSNNGNNGNNDNNSNNSNNGNNGPIDPLGEEIDLNSPYNNSLRINHDDEPEITTDVVADLPIPHPFYTDYLPLDNKGAENIPGQLRIDSSGKLMIKYIKERGVIDDLISSYDNFVMNRLPLILSNSLIDVNNKNDQFIFRFSSPQFELPSYLEEGIEERYRPLFPRQARQEKRNYTASLTIQINQVDEFNSDIVVGGRPIEPIRVKLCEIPVMLGSVIDHLRQGQYKGNDLLRLGECKFDPLGYYIIKGEEMVIMTQNKLRTNRILIYPNGNGDLIGRFTSQHPLGHMPIYMYYDTDGTIRFTYYLLANQSSETEQYNKDKSSETEQYNKDKKSKKNTVNILQIFRVLGKQAPIYSTDERGRIQTDDSGQPISIGKFDDLRDAIAYIVNFIRPAWRRKAMMYLQGSYAKAVNIGDDVSDIYLKSKVKSNYESRLYYAKRKSGEEPSDPTIRSEWLKTKQLIVDQTIEYIFTHISTSHITPLHIRDQAIAMLRKSDNIPADVDLNQYLTPDTLSIVKSIEKKKVVERKIMLLGIMTARFLEVITGQREPDDRDAIGNQRFVTGAQMIEQLFTQMWRRNIARLQAEIDKMSRVNIGTIVGKMNRFNVEMSNGFISAFTPNNWGPPDGTKHENITERLDRGESQLSIYSHLLGINAPTNRRVKSGAIRSVKPSQIGYIDPVQTPSGGSIGLITKRAITSWISINHSDDIVWNYMTKNNDVYEKRNNDLGITDVVLLNGDPRGWCNGTYLRQKMVTLRRELKIQFDTTIVLDGNILSVYTDGGRPTKPVLILDNNLPLIAKRNMWTASFEQLLRNGILEYQDQWELKVHGALATSLQQLTFIREDLNRNRNLLTQKIYALRRDIPKLIEYSPPNNINTDDINRVINRMIDDDLNSKDSAIANWLSTLQRFNDLYATINRTRLIIKRLEIKRYSHVEMDPTSILGVSSSLIPRMDSNPGPRNTYQCNMSSQAMGTNYSNPDLRFTSTYRSLAFGTRSIMATQLQQLLGLDDMPTGNNIMVAIMTMDNNEEDAITIKREALDRGLFTYAIYHSSSVIVKNENHYTSQTSGRKVETSDFITRPNRPLPGHDIDAYDKLDERGLAIPDEIVKPGDCLAGVFRSIKTTTTIRNETNIEIQDNSLYVQKGESGIVDKILVARTGEGDLSITVRVRKVGRPIVGDKVATRQAQKSTIGKIVSEAYLPFTSEGTVPDIMLNPHSIPKRMTMATLIEIMTSKWAALAGERVNGTIFRQFDLDSFMELMETTYGYNRYGNEVMRSPLTGETYPSQIMIGPAYYQLLKHQVAKKIQVRGNKGPRQLLTGQAAKGKKVGGGLRFGESEASGVLAHGASHFTKERMFTSADPHTGAFCDTCNKVTVINMLEDQASCATCGNKDIGSCQIPRTFMTATSMFSTLGIKTSTFKTTEESRATSSFVNLDGELNNEGNQADDGFNDDNSCKSPLQNEAPDPHTNYCTDDEDQEQEYASDDD